MPGTHHLKFIVDDQWRVADSMLTAVDDEGSFANYVAVHISGFTPPSSSGVFPPSKGAGGGGGAPTSPSQDVGRPVVPGQSFWSGSSSAGTADDSHTPHQLTSANTGTTRNPARWTSIFPPELLKAAAEEENYLASSSDPPSSFQDSPCSSIGGVPAPNIPPAPVLPRHLDKLILNAPSIGVKKEDGRGVKDRAREREREERRATASGGAGGTKGKGRSMLGMTSTVMGGQQAEADALPVITPNGTDVGTTAQLPSHTSTHTPKKKSASTPNASNTLSPSPLSSSTATPTIYSIPPTATIADDASVLPVPSHVVLHHLSTSAIRNGVLAVGNTTRYQKKVCIASNFFASCFIVVFFFIPICVDWDWHSYWFVWAVSQYLTTIYYKPT